MMRIKLNRTILESDNPFVVEQWKKAGYAEISSRNEFPTGGELQDGNEPPEDEESLNDGADQKDEGSLSDAEEFSNNKSQDGESKRGRKKAQE